MLLLKRRCADFLRRTEGSVAIIFALSSLVLVATVGLAVDYGQVSLTRTRLQEAADSAVLSAISLQLSPGANAATQASTLQQNALASFNALAAQDDIAIASATATASSAPSPPSVTLNYSGSVPAIFGQLAGLHAYSTPGTAGATAGATANAGPGGGPKFIDIYLLVDVSGSMGVGASPADQLLMNQTIGCTFGCHSTGTDVQARKAGATLRIDAVKSALQQIVSMAQAGAVSGETVRLALISYGDDPVTNAPITSSLNAVSNAVTNLQLAGDHAGTSTYQALQYVQSQIPASGDGSSAAKRLVYVILATDGTSDSADNIGDNITGYFGVNPNFTPPFSNIPAGAPFPHAVPDPSSWEMDVEGLDPAWCQPLKSMGANVMTLEMPYVIPTETTDLRFTYIRDVLLPIIPGQMTACASAPSYHMSASSPSDITAAMSNLFSLAQQPPIAMQTVPRLIQ